MRVRPAEPGAALFRAGLAVLVAFVLLLPVFPSGDGPVHIYYARILYLLAVHRGGIYTGVYAIRHLIQPYSLHYFWLIVGAHLVSTALAEKSFVAAILLVNAFGFRFLARQLGSSCGWVAPWILPLLLSWPLGSGFFNFCFATGVMFFALGLYVCTSRVVTARSMLLYGGALFLLVLSHPVPLLLLILLLAGDTALLLLGAGRAGTPRTLRAFAPQAFCLVLALIAFVFPMLIADKAAVAHSLLSDLRPHAAQVQAIASGDRLSLFFSGGVAGILFTAGLLALAPAAAVVMVRSGALRRLRDGAGLPADRLWLLAWLLLACTLVFPESMNGSALFADRMAPLLWPLLFVSLAAVPFSRAAARWSLGLGVVWTAASLLFGVLYLVPIAQQQQALTNAPLPQNARGLFVAAPQARRPFSAHLAGALLGWGGARAFAAHDDVLLNSPWMQLTIVPLRENGRGGLLRDRLPGEVSEDPAVLDGVLAAHGPEAAAALSGAEFVLYDDPAASVAQLRAAATRLLPGNWQCTTASSYAVCLRGSAN